MNPGAAEAEALFYRRAEVAMVKEAKAVVALSRTDAAYMAESLMEPNAPQNPPQILLPPLRND
eukprot:294376-Prorocentrum_minimum.AAC.1